MSNESGQFMSIKQQSAAARPTREGTSGLLSLGTHPKFSPRQFFRELQNYVGFTEEDADRIRELKEIVEPHFGEVIDRFYEALWKNPRTRMVFEGEEQVARLRRTLLRWLDELFTGPYDEDYFVKRHRIGKVHVNVGLMPQFMFGAMNVMRLEMIAIITDDERGLGGGDETARALMSLEKMLDMELTIMVQSYWDALMEIKLQVPAALAMGLAHEIRNPLNAVNLNISLMERRLRGALDDTSQFDPILEVMRSEVRRIRGLTGEIMDFAKPIQVTPRWHDVQGLIDEIEAIHGPTLEVSRIEFDARLEGDGAIWCDIDRIKQVLVNLITNAVEAIGEEGKISLEIFNEDEATVIHVSDDGEGMPPGLRYRIFDLFYTTKAAGTGLGLPIVRKIVDAHNGAIDVNSRVGHGTIFTIFLPRPEKESVDVEAAERGERG